MYQKTFPKTCCLLFIFLFSFSALSQNLSPSTNLHQWGAVTLFHGLPSDHVRAIAQTADGILWFGTDSGLAQYDGRRIEKVAIGELATAHIRALALDSTGTLWVGTDNGAGRLIDRQFLPVVETQGKRINAIDCRNHIMMVSDQGFVYDCDNSSSSLRVTTISPQEHLLLNVESSKSPLPLTGVAITNDRLIVGSRGRGLLAIEQNEVKEILSHPRPFFIEVLSQDTKNHIYFGARNFGDDGGLYRCDDLLHPVRLDSRTGTVTAIVSGADGELWVGTAEQGVFLFQGDKEVAHFTFENTAGGLRSNNIYTILIDREGVVWFGTDRGVCRYAPGAMRVETLSASAESNFVRALFQSSDGFIWCGTNCGLFVRCQSNWCEVKELAGKIIHTITEDEQNRLFVGTAAGLYAGEPVTHSAPAETISGDRHFSRLEAEGATTDSIRALARFQGTVYAATFGRGLERVDGLTRTPVTDNANEEVQRRQTVSLYAEGNERLLVGTADAGVFTYDGRRAITDNALASLNDKAVWSITPTNDGTLWFATNEGLFALVQNQLIPVIRDIDVKSVIPAIEPEAAGSKAAVWCATANGGLFKVLLNNNLVPIISHFDSEQGLPSQKAFALLQVDGTNNKALLIGTNTGIVRYEPGIIAPIIKASRVSGSRIYSEAEIQQGLRLEYPQNSLLVEATAISSRTFPEQFQYAFTLYDAAGKTLAQKSSRDSQMLIQGLKSGSYRLVCRAFTGDLMPSDPLTIQFTVARAPFPFASTALAILLLLAMAAVWWGYRQNTKMARANEALASTNQQLAETRLQLANETETERRRIARDLHDQTLADLRRLMMHTDRLPSDESAERMVNPGIFRSEIESVSAEIRRICEDLSPSVLENVGLAAALEWALTNAVAHLPEGKKFSYEFNFEEGIEERLHLAPVMQIHLYRIAQEVINNISRHSGARQVKVHAGIRENGDFILEIADNGRGFDLKRVERQGRGIANIRSRASLIETEVTWQLIAEGGSLFTLIKPGAENRSDSLKKLT